jgi:hypothetical protein
MAGPDSSGQSEAGLTAEDIKYLLGLPKALTSFMRGPDCEIELILNLAALFRLAGTSLSRALRSRYGAAATPAAADAAVAWEALRKGGSRGCVPPNCAGYSGRTWT